LEKKNFRIKFNDFTSHSSIDENDEIQKNREENITEKYGLFGGIYKLKLQNYRNKKRI